MNKYIKGIVYILNYTFKSLLFRLLIIFVLCLVILVCFTLYRGQTRFDGKVKFVFIPTSQSFSKSSFVEYLDTSGILSDKNSFIFYSNLYGLWNKIKPGKYDIKKNSSIRDIIMKIKSGIQNPVSFVLNKVRTIEELGALCGKIFESDSAAFTNYFKSNEIKEIIDENEHDFLSIFIPNTYYLFWNSDPQKFVLRMKEENKRFWNKNRLHKATELRLSEKEVYALASVVEEETIKDEEKPTIASVYLNRLRSGMKLEADPTVKFCVKNFELRRLTFKHINNNADCVFNTYKRYGLPPGPICTPSIKTIDAVLNATQTNYFYFCARAERDGFHTFSSSYKEHIINARKFHKVLNANNIR